MIDNKLETLGLRKGWTPALGTHALGSFHSNLAWKEELDGCGQALGGCKEVDGFVECDL